MMMRRDYDILLKNNSGAKSKHGLVQGFVVRHKEYNQLIEEAKRSSITGIPFNFLIIGPKGAGKTTLLHRLKYGFEDEGLTNSLLPVIFKEEQYNIVDSLTLWLRVIEYCDDFFGWHSVNAEADALRRREKVNADSILSLIKNELINNQHRLIIFIENINDLFKKLGADGQQQIGGLAQEGLINFLGSSTSYTDGNIDFTDQKYHYFQKLELGGLNKDECETLLVRIGREFGKEQEMEKIIRNHPGRVEALRRLTGGIPRIIVYLFQIFLDNATGKAMRDLYQLVDHLTDLYKGELNRLSTQQLQVVDVLAKNWDAIAVKDIASETMLESKNISSVLGALEKISVVERVKMEGKNNLYRIKDRFLNIWYLMRHGRRTEKENVKWLVRFFDLWCDEEELLVRVQEHLAALKDGSMDTDTAIDMGNTYLSCKKLPSAVKYSLYEESQKLLPERVAKTLRISKFDLYEAIETLIKQNKGDEAIKKLEIFDKKDATYFGFEGYVHIKLGKPEQAAESFEKVLALKPSDGQAAITLALIYCDFLHDTTKAEGYFLAALKAKHYYAAVRLGDIAYYVHSDSRQAEKYHKLAIRKKFKESYALLWRIYNNEDDYEKALELSLEEVERGIAGAFVRLGRTYLNLQMETEAQRALEMAVERGEKGSFLHLASLHVNKQAPDLDIAESLFRKAVDNKDSDSYFNLGKFFIHAKNDKAAAEQIWKEGTSAGEAMSAHRIGHYYDEAGDYEKADWYFLEALRLGHQGSIFCMTSAVYRRRRSDKKAIALQLLQDHQEVVNDALPQGSILYANILLWNNLPKQALERFRLAYPKIKEILDEDDSDEREEELAVVAQELAEFLIHLMARRMHNECVVLFEDNNDGIDLKAIVKPVYFTLMTELKDKFPNEYLKAGAELQDTIVEIQQKITDLKQALNYN
ncbi:hypothetical protein [Chitinophaga deserti]|uniref:hypothetical protein n=1 Tax=Chitinophaga deserti TaxID=2164099 RepID=UPI000D6AA55F|nr:hypothetical protein [Chitinophaga deserti]